MAADVNSFSVKILMIITIIIIKVIKLWTPW